MGHFSQGASRERTQVLRYGFRTINGRTGGVSVEALARAAEAACTNRLSFMVGKCRKIEREEGKAWPAKVFCVSIPAERESQKARKVQAERFGEPIFGISDEPASRRSEGSASEADQEERCSNK